MCACPSGKAFTTKGAPPPLSAFGAAHIGGFWGGGSSLGPRSFFSFLSEGSNFPLGRRLCCAPARVERRLVLGFPESPGRSFFPSLLSPHCMFKQLGTARLFLSRATSSRVFCSSWRALLYFEDRLISKIVVPRAAPDILRLAKDHCFWLFESGGLPPPLVGHTPRSSFHLAIGFRSQVGRPR